MQGDADDREKLREKAKQDRRERERQTLMDDMEGEILKQHGMVRVLILTSAYFMAQGEVAARGSTVSVTITQIAIILIIHQQGRSATDMEKRFKEAAMDVSRKEVGGQRYWLWEVSNLRHAP